MTDLDLTELIGDDVQGPERDALERAHALLIEAGPPAEIPHSLRTWEPRRATAGGPRSGARQLLRPRARALAGLLGAVLGVAIFAGGYVVGHNDQTFRTEWSGPMRGTAAAPDASAVVQIGPSDERGNWPMLISVRGLPELPEHQYYTLWVTRKGKAFAPCGSFSVGKGTTRFELTIPWSKKAYDGWMVRPYDAETEKLGDVVLRTASI